jgi:galactokinase
VKALRDVRLDSEKWKAESGKMKVERELVFKRARHVISENERVLEAVEVMRKGNAKRLGQLFNESHESLKNDFEVTNDALNIIVECAREQVGCYGARMTGAGFGGCAVALVDEENVEVFVKNVTAAYRLRSGLEASVYVCKSSAGANQVL